MAGTSLFLPYTVARKDFSPPDGSCDLMGFDEDVRGMGMDAVLSGLPGSCRRLPLRKAGFQEAVGVISVFAAWVGVGVVVSSSSGGTGSSIGGGIFEVAEERMAGEGGRLGSWGGGYRWRCSVR